MVLETAFKMVLKKAKDDLQYGWNLKGLMKKAWKILILTFA